MVVKPSHLRNNVETMKEKAIEVEQNSGRGSGRGPLKAMQRVQQRAEEMEEIIDENERQQDRVLVGEQLRDALQGTGIAATQREIGEYIMSVIAEHGFPTQPGLKEPFEDLLEAAQQSEKQLAKLGVSEGRVLEDA